MDNLLKPEVVQARYGYKHRQHFWRAVHRDGIPYIQLNQRVIRFCPKALMAWEQKRSVGR